MAVSGQSINLDNPPTDVEVLALLVALEMVSPIVHSVVCRLVIQRDRLLNEVKRLKEGKFTEEEFGNLCHGFDDSDIIRFKHGCEEYQHKLFGCRANEVGENHDK